MRSQEAAAVRYSKVLFCSFLHVGHTQKKMLNLFLVFYATVEMDKIAAAAGLEKGKQETNNDNTTNATAFLRI